MRCNSSPGKISHLHLSFSNSKSQSKNEINKPKEINIQNIKQIGNYIIGCELGSGAFGKVVLATHILTNEKVAIKILDKIILSETPEDLELVYQEISILKIVKHKNIAQLYEILETPKHIFIIIEYCEGKDLMDYILTKSKLTEIESLKIFQQLINTLLYLHSQNITHRDIKIDNMLLDKNKNLKLVDFGLSTYYSDDKLLNQPCGTVVYAAPEVLEGKEYHGMLADVWSSGIVLYGMLSGFLPFCDNDDEINKKNVLKGKIEIPNFFPPLVIDLLSHMLQENPIKRFTLQDIRDHPWFNLRKFNMIPGIVIGYNKIPVDDDVLNECLKFGFNKDKLKDSIVNNKFNNGTAVYYLLVKKKVKNGKSSVSDLCSKEFIDFVLNEKNVVFYNEKKNYKYDYDIDDKNYDYFNNKEDNVCSEGIKFCNDGSNVINKENNIVNSRNNNSNIKDDKFEIEILSFEKENIQINGNKINKNEGKKVEKILNQNLLKTTKESSNNSINNNSINKNSNHIKTEKIPHKKFINRKAFINKSIEKDKKSKLIKEISKEEKQKNIQNLSMNETIEEQLYKKKKKDVITKLKKSQGVIIQTKIKNLLSQKIDEIKYQTTRTKKNKNYNLSKSIDSSKKLYDEENELNEKNKAITKRKNNYMNTSIDNNTPKKIGIKKNSVLNSSIKNSQSHNNKKNENKEKTDITRNQIKKVLSRTISNNSNINNNNDTNNINSNSKNILTSYRNYRNDKTNFSKLNLSIQFDKIAKNIKIKRNVLKFEKNKYKKYNKYISFSSISTINQNTSSKTKNKSKERNNLSRSISEKSNLQMRIKYEEKIRKNNKILNRSVCGLINKKYEVILNKSLREDIRNKSLDKKINLKKELLIPKDKQIKKIIHLNYYTDRNNKSNNKYNMESSVICYRKKSPYEIRDLSDSPKHNNLLNEKTRKRKIPWKIKKDGIDKNLEYDAIYHKYIQKLTKPKYKKNKINQSKIPLNQTNIRIKPIYHNNDLNISINKISNTNFEKYNISVKNNNNKNERKKSIRIRNKDFIKGKNHISLSSNISANSSNSTYDIGMIYLSIYNGPIDISCIYSKDNSFSNCIKFITEKLKKNNIYFNNSKQNKFSCLKNGKHFEIEIYKLSSCIQGINPFYYKFKSKQFPNDNKLFYTLFSNN